MADENTTPAAPKEEAKTEAGLEVMRRLKQTWDCSRLVFAWRGMFLMDTVKMDRGC